MIGNHINGMNYSSIMSLACNRNAFVFNCIEAFKSFPSTAEFTIFDLYHVLHLVCNDFPKQVIEDALSPLFHPAISKTANLSNKYSIKSMQVALYFSILYVDWLKLVENFFQMQNFYNGTSNVTTNLYMLHTPQNIAKLQAQLYNIEKEKSCSNFQIPHKYAIETICKQLMNQSIVNNGGNGNQGNNNKYLSFDMFKKELYLNPYIITDIFKVPLNGVL